MRKNVAGQFIAAQINSRTDGSPITTGTVNVFVTIDNGAQNPATGPTVIHEGNGLWSYNPDQAETNGNFITFTFVHSSGVNQSVLVYTVSFDPHDTVRLGLTSLPNAVAGGAAGLPVIGTGTNQFKSDSSANVTFANTVIATVTSVTNDVGITQTGADKVWTSAARTLTSLGASLVQEIWDALTSTLTTAGSIGLGLSRFVNFGFYQNAAIWIDTVNGTPGAVSGVNGTNRNPVDNMADANTLATALGLNRFEVSNGSTITFVASQVSQFFSARGATINLGGQDIGDSTFFGALVSGVSTGALPVFRECFMIGSTSLGTNFILDDCTLAGTIVVTTGVQLIKDCVTAITGGSPPVIDFGAAIGATTVNLRKYSGHIEVQNMGQVAGADNFFFEGIGDLTINANCIAGTVTIRGIIGLTNNGAVTLDVDQRVTNNTITNYIYDELTAEARPAGSYGQLFKDFIDAAISGRATQASVDSIQADTDNIQTRIPAALVGGRMDSDVGSIQNDAITAAAIAPDAIGASEFAQAAADKVWASVSRTLTALGGSLVQEVWDRATSLLITVGSIGKLLVDNVDVPTSTRLAPTTPGNTLDVTVTGEAGIDLDNTVGTLAKGTEITGFNDLSAVEVNAEVDTALADIHLDHLLAVATTLFPGVSGSILGEMLERVTTWRFVIEALSQAPSGSGASPATIADAVWDEDIVAAHGTADSAGLLIRALGALISQRANNPNLNALLGIPDAASRDVPEQVWLETTRTLTALGFTLNTANFTPGFLTAALLASNVITSDKMAADAFDKLFQRDLDQVEAGAPIHSLLTACLKAVSRVADNAGTLEVYRTNGTTIHMSQVVTINAALDPIAELSVGV